MFLVYFTFHLLSRRKVKIKSSLFKKKIGMVQLTYQKIFSDNKIFSVTIQSVNKFDSNKL